MRSGENHCCHGCEMRCVGCHATCGIYKAECDEREADRATAILSRQYSDYRRALARRLIRKKLNHKKQ